MTLPAWPTGVPADPLDGEWTGDQPDATPNVTEYESGAIRMRVRTPTRRETVSEAILMTPAQYATFEDWFINTIGRGVGQFTKKVRGPSGALTRTCRFVNGTYKRTFRGNHYTVSYQLHVLH